MVGCALWGVIYPLDASSILPIMTTKSASSTAHFPLRDKTTTPRGELWLCVDGEVAWQTEQVWETPALPWASCVPRHLYYFLRDP